KQITRLLTVSVFHQALLQNSFSQRQAIRIKTDAQNPDGSDAVIMLEMVREKEMDGRSIIELKRTIKQGDNISVTGEDTEKGTILVSKGTYINPGIVAILATFGYKNVPVSQKPTVGIIATGSELLAVDEELQPGKIRNSNAYMTYSQIKRAGAVPVYLGQFKDDFLTCYEH